MHLVLCGNYGAGNEGDEAILESLIKLLYECVPGVKITAVSGNPQATAARHQINAVPMVPSGFRSLLLDGLAQETRIAFATCDGVILGGGGLLQDDEPRALWIWGVHVWYARHHKKPVYAFAQTIGPFQKKWTKMVANWILKKCVGVSVRDAPSLKFWPQAVQTVDAVFFNETAPSQKAEKGKIILNLRPWKFLNKKIIQEIIHFCEKQPVTLLPFGKGDAALLEKVAKAAGPRTEICKINEAPRILQQARLVISMRLHPLLLAIKQKKPVLALAYTQKVSGAMGAFHQEKYTLSLDRITAHTLDILTQELTDNPPVYDFTALDELRTVGRKDLQKFFSTLGISHEKSPHSEHEKSQVKNQ